MAIHKDVPGLEVTIEVDGTSLVEFAHSNDEIKHENHAVQAHLGKCTITKYVECVTGAQFRIKLSVDDKYKWDCPRIGFFTFVDGGFIRGVVPPSTKYNNKNWAYLVEGAISGPPNSTGTLRRFKFTEISTTSDTVDMAEIQEEKVRMSKVGEIMINVYRLDKGHKSEYDYRYPSELNNDHGNTVHEKTLKGEAKSHGIALEGAEHMALPRLSSHKKLDGKDYPIAIFKFKYRSNEALKQLGIIERTPEPENQNILSGLTLEERRDVLEYARNRKRMRDTGAFVKQEDTHSEPIVHAKKRLRKTEPSGIIVLDDE